MTDSPALPYPHDRIPGHVALACDGKHFISGAELTPKGRLSTRQRNVKRLFYRMCKAYGLHPKRMRGWWHQAT